MAIFFGFKEKKHASMFTTNIAARGLDFPSVDWVIQVIKINNYRDIERWRNYFSLKIFKLKRLFS